MSMSSLCLKTRPPASRSAMPSLARAETARAKARIVAIGAERFICCSPPAQTAPTDWQRKALNGEALAAAAGALGVRILEHEARGEIVLFPVHDAADEIEDGCAVDVESAAGS